MDTPYKWTKQIPSFFGGTRQGMAISWPAKIKDKGGIRWQFHHVIDIVPTLLEVTGIPAPVMVDGIAQKPIEGVSMAYTFDKANADAPSHHHTQYFEMLGVQGLYNDGWMLSAVPIRAPWQLGAKAVQDPASAFKFELYELSKDWTQYTDVAAANPRRVKEMKDLMFGEFAKYQVLPLDASASPRFVTPRPSAAAGRTVFNYSGSTVSIPNGNQPSVLNTSYTITADIDVPQGGAEGVIVGEGGRFVGYGLYLLKGKPVFTYNLLDLKRTRWEGPEALAPGKHTIDVRLQVRRAWRGDAGVQQSERRGSRRHRDADGGWQARIDPEAGSDASSGPAARPDVHHRHRGPTPVDDHDYKVPFKFTGKIDKLTIALDPPKLTTDDVERLKAAHRAAQDAN